ELGDGVLERAELDLRLPLPLPGVDQRLPALFVRLGGLAQRARAPRLLPSTGRAHEIVEVLECRRARHVARAARAPARRVLLAARFADHRQRAARAAWRAPSVHMARSSSFPLFYLLQRATILGLPENAPIRVIPIHDSS